MNRYYFARGNHYFRRGRNRFEQDGQLPYTAWLFASCCTLRRGRTPRRGAAPFFVNDFLQNIDNASVIFLTRLLVHELQDEMYSLAMQNPQKQNYQSNLFA